MTISLPSRFLISFPLRIIAACRRSQELPGFPPPATTHYSAEFRLAMWTRSREGRQTHAAAATEQGTFEALRAAGDADAPPVVDQTVRKVDPFRLGDDL